MGSSILSHRVLLLPVAVVLEGEPLALNTLDRSLGPCTGMKVRVTV